MSGDSKVSTEVSFVNGAYVRVPGLSGFKFQVRVVQPDHREPATSRLFEFENEAVGVA